ncbi:hypothetical protein PRIPAC_90645, partial [Pristionchus pacificus]|uniref:Uncharacterized protein n=1 Tax=Pristionchus pacificus TaxID=54126 RepID=A0A2A6B3T6_PRIPA
SFFETELVEVYDSDHDEKAPDDPREEKGDCEQWTKRVLTRESGTKHPAKGPSCIFPALYIIVFLSLTLIPSGKLLWLPKPKYEHKQKHGSNERGPRGIFGGKKKAEEGSRWQLVSSNEMEKELEEKEPNLFFSYNFSPRRKLSSRMSATHITTMNSYLSQSVTVGDVAYMRKTTLFSF